MDNKHQPVRSTYESIIFTRYKQILIGSIVALTLGSVNFLLNSGNYRPSFNFLEFVFYIGVLATCVTALIFSETKKQLSMMIFVWGVSIATSYFLWISGSLQGASNVIYPALMMIAALLLPAQRFKVVFLFLCGMILFLGVSEMQGFNPNTLKPFQYEDVINIIIVISISAFGGWQVGRDYRLSLNRLKVENERNQASEEEIYFLVHHDPLTGLMSLKKSKMLFSEMQRNKKDKIHFFFLDLDNFKVVNDTYSHLAGDELLVEVANRLSSITINSDIVSRIGGDEFLIIVQREDYFLSYDFAKAILKVVTQPLKLSEGCLEVTTSIGIAVSPYDGMTFDDVRKKADIAMYKAKQQGKNNFEYYNETLHQEMVRKNAIISGLKQAIKENTLSLHFQSKHDIVSGKMIGAEALVHWTENNPLHVPTEEFIPIIESTELIIDLGKWVIEEACQTCKRWHDAGHTQMHIAVNVSVMQLSRNNLEKIITDALEASQLSPEFLEVELTEHLMLKQTDKTLVQLDRLKKIGVSLAIDDFGTGYSNLSYLTRFNVDVLKIDRSFTYKIDHCEEDLAIVKAIITMANILGLITVAEGVENKDIWKVLQSLGCDLGQGFYWSKPIPEQEYNQTYFDKVVIEPTPVH